MQTVSSAQGEDSAPVIEEANATLEKLSAQERIRWTLERYGEHVAMSASFGIHSAALLHMATSVKPDIPVVFIDTGYLFKETYLYARELTERLGLNLKKYQPLISAAEQEALHGKLWEQGADKLAEYNFARKVEPMNRAITELGAKAWIAGLRRDSASTRKSLSFARQQKRVMKIHPILDWSDRDIYRYAREHDLPLHPLWEQGYVSVGDWHSTSKLLDGMTPEQTRFNGVKRECGLHEESGRIDFQI